MFRRKKGKSTDHDVGDPLVSKVDVTEGPDGVTRIDVTWSLTEEQMRGLDFEHKRDELGLTHPETLRALQLYAVALGDVPGRREDAVELLTWLVDAGTDDQEIRLPALSDLGGLLRAGGSPALAERRLREALSGQERASGQDSPETLETVSNLARVLIDLGRSTEAEGLMRDTVARRTRTLGATHPDTLSSRNILAGTFRGSPDRLAEAERMYEAILADTDGVSPLTLSVRHNLAAVFIHQGKHRQALRMYRRLITDRSRQQGDDHPATWSARHNYASVLNRLDRAPEAEKVLVEVLDGYQRTRGPRHAATLGVQVDLAATKANQGREAEAAPLLRDAIEGYRASHGPHHPRVRELTGILDQLDT